jgi:hypothetical protein
VRDLRVASFLLQKSGELAEALHACAVSHLEMIDDAGIAAMQVVRAITAV